MSLYLVMCLGVVCGVAVHALVDWLEERHAKRRADLRRAMNRQRSTTDRPFDYERDNPGGLP